MKSISSLYLFLISIALVFSACNIPSSFRVNSLEMANTLKIGSEFKIAKTDKLVRNDFACFYLHDSIPYAKLSGLAAFRIIGLPGEHIRISNGTVYVNDVPQTEVSTQKLAYVVDLRSIEGYDSQMAFIKPYTGFPITRSYVSLNLDTCEFHKLAKSLNMILMRDYKKYKIEQFDNEDTLFLMLKIKNELALRDSLPMLHIPRKGDTIQIPPNLQKFYVHGIKHFKSLGGDKYISSENMYFMVGDNWYDAIDSRQIGMILESEIVGVLQK